jgi:uncharacterized protein
LPSGRAVDPRIGSSLAMPSRSDSRFDAFRLSSAARSLTGKTDPATLPRLADQVADGTGEIVWRIVGTKDGQGRPAIAVELDGSVPLACQRCLGTVVVPVAQRTELLLAASEDELARLDADSELEVALANAPLDAQTLVEDELLLTLPYAPRHEGSCPGR